MSPNPTDISARLHVRGSTKPKAEVSHDIVPSATGELLEVDDIPGHIVQRKVMSGIVSNSCPQQKGLLNMMYVHTTSHYMMSTAGYTQHIMGLHLHYTICSLLPTRDPIYTAYYTGCAAHIYYT